TCTRALATGLPPLVTVPESLYVVVCANTEDAARAIAGNHRLMRTSVQSFSFLRRKSQAALVALLLFSATSRPRAAPPLVRSATIAITSDGTRVVTINPDSNSITALDTKRELVVCMTPQTLSIDGARVFVVCRDGS